MFLVKKYYYNIDKRNTVMVCDKFNTAVWHVMNDLFRIKDDLHLPFVPYGVEEGKSFSVVSSYLDGKISYEIVPIEEETEVEI